MSDTRGMTTDGPADASDAIEPMGADRTAIEPIERDGDATDRPRPIDGDSPSDGSAPVARERQDPEHVGVDWERTSRDKS